MKKLGTKSFIFLEVLDSEINALFSRLRKEFCGEGFHTNIHLTIRGPYFEKLQEEKIRNFYRELKGDPLLIQGVDMFNNSGEYVVYIKVEQPYLKNIWWKPDYPIGKFGMNPHISVYVGNNKCIAYSVLEFLKKENIKLLCRNYKLTQYVSKQGLLFSDDNEKKEQAFLELCNRKLVSYDILERAYKAVKNC